MNHMKAISVCMYHGVRTEYIVQYTHIARKKGLPRWLLQRSVYESQKPHLVNS